MKTHRDLLAWSVGMDLVERVYHITSKFPKMEVYGLSSQMQRAAVSVPSNIAEGAADRTPQQFANYLSSAIGSLAELDTQVEITFRLKYINETEKNELAELISRVKALTYGLKKSIKK